MEPIPPSNWPDDDEYTKGAGFWIAVALVALPFVGGLLAIILAVADKL